MPWGPWMSQTMFDMASGNVPMMSDETYKKIQEERKKKEEKKRKFLSFFKRKKK